MIKTMKKDLKIEIEKKFQYNNWIIFEKFCIFNWFKLKWKTFKETDIYFTDSKYIFIENKTCLRIRQVWNKSELTYKWPSNNEWWFYSKLEINLSIKNNEFDNYILFIHSLWYETYCKVEKSRKIYTKSIDWSIYNIVFDNIKNCWKFVEFEILVEKNYKWDTKQLLNEFISQYNDFLTNEVTLPYRDIVRNSLDKNNK